MKAAQVVALARELLGTPYGHQGRVAGVAVDCAGVPVHIANRLGMDIRSVARYGRQPVPNEMRAELDTYLVRSSREALQIGDVVWIRFQTEPQHLGVIGDYPGGLSLIHAYNGAGIKKVVEHRLDATWRRRIVAVWRFPAVEL
jgi:cell wall-associated NlpC family hydrolase